VSGFEQYRQLVVTACEWRAFGVDDPALMAERVYAKLAGKSGGLRELYKAIEKVVDDAYRQAAGRKSFLEALQGQFTFARPAADKSAERQILDALSECRHRQTVLLREAYWDELAVEELAQLHRTSPEEARQALDSSLEAFSDRLAKKAGQRPDDPAAALRGIKPGVHHRWG
jgi:hypothetical protein